MDILLAASVTRLFSGIVIITFESSTDDATTLSRMNFSGYGGHATIFSRMCFSTGQGHAEAFNDVDARWIMQIAEGNTLSRPDEFLSQTELCQSIRAEREREAVGAGTKTKFVTNNRSKTKVGLFNVCSCAAQTAMKLWVDLRNCEIKYAQPKNVDPLSTKANDSPRSKKRSVT